MKNKIQIKSKQYILALLLSTTKAQSPPESVSQWYNKA